MYINAFSSLVACSVMLIFIVLSRSIVPRLLNCEDDGLLQDYYYYYYFFFFPFSLLSILYIPLVIVKLQGTRVGLNSDKRLLISYIMHRYYENILCMHCAKKGKYTYIQRYEGIRTFADPVAANLIRACAIILQKCVILYMQWCIYIYVYWRMSSLLPRCVY